MANPTPSKDEVARRAGHLVEQGYHWAEAFMLAVGESVLGELDDRTLKMTTGFAGGIGLTERDLCGALTSGIMVIGARYGRTQPNEPDNHCQALVTSYRDRFNREIGGTICGELRAEQYGSRNQVPCSILVERAARLLLTVLEEE